MLKRKYLIFVLLIAFCGGGAHAAMESGNYVIPSLTISGGGEEEMNSDNYMMQDIKISIM